MTIDDMLKNSMWVCQWRCPFMGELNRSRKQDLPQGIDSLDDLSRHLICHGCKMDLGLHFGHIEEAGRRDVPDES